MTKAIFLDRDGTINEEVDYLFKVDDFTFLPRVPEAIKTFRNAGYLVIVITNQSGVARGYYREEDVLALHRHIDAELSASGAAVDAWYYCPHHPEKGVDSYRIDCACRKPLPGMIHAAAERFRIDLPMSYVIGDKKCDVDAAIAAGAKPVLVRTGYGASEEARLPAGVAVFDDLFAAAAEIAGERL